MRIYLPNTEDLWPPLSRESSCWWWNPFWLWVLEVNGPKGLALRKVLWFWSKLPTGCRFLELELKLTATALALFEFALLELVARTVFLNPVLEPCVIVTVGCSGKFISGFLGLFRCPKSVLSGRKLNSRWPFVGLIFCLVEPGGIRLLSGWRRRFGLNSRHNVRSIAGITSLLQGRRRFLKIRFECMIFH